MISAKESLSVSKNSIQKRLDFLEKIINNASSNSETNVFVNEANVTDLVKEELIKLGYSVSPINNGKVNISWK
jgi:superfamily II DNA/RNA helicase